MPRIIGECAEKRYTFHMDPNTSQLLREILEKTEENNRLLRKMHRAAVWGRVARLLYWVIILGAALGAYYYLQPYIEGLFSAYNSLLSGVESVQNAANQIPNLGGLLGGDSR